MQNSYGAGQRQDVIKGENLNHYDALLKAIISAHQWQDIIDSGKARSIHDVDSREGVPKG